jgi:hypothetical protein
MHNPDPVLPLETTFWSRVYEAFNRATEAYDMPVRLKTRCINTYFYMAAKTVVAPEQMEFQRARADERMNAAMAGCAALTDGAEIRAHLAWWDARLAGAAPRLLAHLEETLNTSASVGLLPDYLTFTSR